MDKQDFQKRWPEMREQIKKEYPEIEDVDLLYEIEKEVELLERLQEKTGKTREEIYNWLHIMG